MHERASIGEAMELRNILLVNSVPDNLGFIASWISARARVIRLREFGISRASLSINLPIGISASVLLPSSTSYLNYWPAPDSRILTSVLGSSIEPRMVVVQGAPSVGPVAELCQYFHPDIVAVDARIESIEHWCQEHNLMPASHIVSESEREIWGLNKLQLSANERGKKSFRQSLDMFDIYYRMRRKETSHVYGVEELCLCDGFYPIEVVRGEQCAWTGPQTVATLLFPAHNVACQRITLFLRDARLPIDRDHINVLLDGDACSCKFFLDEEIEIVTGHLRAGCSHRLDILQSRGAMAIDASRQAGFALHKLKIESVP